MAKLDFVPLTNLVEVIAQDDVEPMSLNRNTNAVNKPRVPSMTELETFDIARDETLMLDGVFRYPSPLPETTKPATILAEAKAKVKDRTGQAHLYRP